MYRIAERLIELEERKRRYVIDHLDFDSTVHDRIVAKAAAEQVGKTIKTIISGEHPYDRKLYV